MMLKVKNVSEILYVGNCVLLIIKQSKKIFFSVLHVITSGICLLSFCGEIFESDLLL